MLNLQDPLAQLWPQLRMVQIHALLLTFFVAPFRVLVKGRRHLKWYLDLWGLYPMRGPKSGAIWIHAVTEGEMRVALTLIRALPEGASVVVTTNSAQATFLREISEERAEIAVYPFPFTFAIRRFLRRYCVRQLILVEATDLRPLLYLRMVRQEIPVAVVNGWANEKWLHRNRDFLPLLHQVQVFGVHGEGDRDVLRGIGVAQERIAITGEMKFDVLPEPSPETEARMQDLAGGRPILIAGSTHPDEESQVLDAFEQLGGGQRAMLILAPRFPRHCDKTELLLRRRTINFVRRSRFPISGRPAVVLLDQTGELAALYRIAAAAFIGWSFPSNGGGHNPIEAARFAVPIAAGPAMANFKFQADLFDRAGAWQRVADSGELARTWSSWLDAPELARQIGLRGAELVASQQGLAITRTLELLGPLVPYRSHLGTTRTKKEQRRAGA